MGENPNIWHSTPLQTEDVYRFSVKSKSVVPSAIGGVRIPSTLANIY